MTSKDKKIYDLLQKYEDKYGKEFFNIPQFLAYCRKNGLKLSYLGEGVSRVCYRLNRTNSVLKVDMDRTGYNNSIEVANFKTASNEERKHLANLIWNSYKCLFIIQEYIPYRYSSFVVLNAISVLEKKFKHGSCIVKDLHDNNLGYRKKNPNIPVVFDYAHD